MSRRVLARGLVVAAVTLAVSCGNDDQGLTIVVGAGDSMESNLLAQIYSGALSRTGVSTSVAPHLGNRADYFAALDAGTVTVVGEHTGELLAFLDANSKARKPADATEVATDGVPEPSVPKAVNASLPEGLAVSDPADGTDMRPRMLLTEAAATRDRVRSIGDLAARCGELEVGVAPVPEVLRASTDTLRVSGCGFARTKLFPDAAALRKALLDGEVQAGILGGPPALVPGATDGLAVLSDDDYALRAENVLAVYRKGELGDRQIRKLNYVAGELTTDDLVVMIGRIRDGAVPADVARDWLDSHAL
ncbi:glycine betaine ABC transporter substrate-binding protein [Nocardia sp. NBC_01009]|uniref:glycine betaine ABC transporter substrate-binding protein n=1 Tax=Nocardia sp. NBC_01009 TaxID=2975996 RepID=UPI00386F1749|nr:transporter [Nocardia sp. NBC_01009]